MHLKNATGQGQYLAAYDTTVTPVVGKTGAASTITGAWSADGGAETAGFTTSHPTEIGGGVYWQPWTQAESNGNRISNRWTSSTSGVVIDPVFSDAAGMVLDDLNTGATHNVTNSAGKQLRSIVTNTDVIYPTSGTVNLTAATSTTATLDVLASAVSQAYQWDVISILAGTGAGQSRVITNYTTGRVATVSPAFTTTPDATSTFEITPTASVQVVSYIAGQDPASLVLNAVAASYNTALSIGAKINLIGSDTSGVTTLLTRITVAPPTAAAIATAVWTDTTAGDFTTLTSPGKILFAQLGGAFTTTSSSVFTAPALANAPTSSGTITADITSINGTTFTGPNLPVILADGVAHGGTPGGSTATLAMQTINVTNPGGDAIAATGSASGGAGMSLSGLFGLLSSGAAGGETFGAVFRNGSAANNTPAVLMDGFNGNGGIGLQIRGAGGFPAIFANANSAAHTVHLDSSGGFKALLLSGDAATDALAIAAGAADPIDIFDDAGRVLVRFDATGLASFFTIDTGERYAAPYSDAVTGSVVGEIVSNAGIDEAQLLVDIDTQLSGTHGAGDWTGGGGGIDAVGIRAAIGMASANLDAQLAALLAQGVSISTTLDSVATDVTTIIGQTADGLDAAGIRAAIGMAAANLDGQLAGIDAHVLSRLAASAYVVPLDAAGIRDAIGLVTNNLDTLIGNIPTAAENADKLLGRNVEGSSDGVRTVSEAMYFLRNRWNIVGGILHVYTTNDSTESWQANVAQNSSTPVTGIDPT